MVFRPVMHGLATIEDRVLAYGDCAINPDPNAPPIHDWLAKELSNTLNSILVYEKTLDDTRIQQSEIVAKFDKDIDRFKHLKGMN